MTNYQAFEKMIHAKESGNIDSFSFYAIKIAGSENNPYPIDSQEYQLYSSLYGNYLTYRGGRVGDRKSKMNLVDTMNAILAINSNNPFNSDEVEEVVEEIKEEKKEELKKEEAHFEKNEDIEVIQDIRYVMVAMVKAYNEGSDINFKQFAIHLVDIAEENPFNEGTEEYNVFEEMVMSYRKKPANIRRVHVLAERLCEIINYTEIDSDRMQPKKVVNDPPQKILGVLPEEDKEKKSWFKFLHPWKKDGEE